MNGNDSSIYWILRDGYSSRDRTKETMQDYIVEDNIRCTDFNDWQKRKSAIYKDSGHNLLVKYLICPEIVEYDMFGFQNYDHGLFISEKMKNGLLKKKIKGLDIAGNMYYKFAKIEPS